jgi:hypothetical protein
MEDIEAVWQNCETMRTRYCSKQYDANRGGEKLSKGCLYCPVFKGHYHSLYFLDLPDTKVFANIDLPATELPSQSAGGSNAGGGSSDAVAPQTPHANNASQKRQRTE